VPATVDIATARPRVLEFFAGIGLARMGLERQGFRVVWANDYEPDKWDLYRTQFGDDPSDEHAFALGDIAAVRADDLPGDAALAWGSSPCTDLSLAGSRGGLRAGESNAFWQYIRVLDELGSDRPGVAVLENVVGLATSHGGDDLAAAVRAFNDLGYSVDVLALDARRFIPQSRPRLFLVGAQRPPADSGEPDNELRPDWLQAVYDDPTLRMHRAPLPVPPAPLLRGFGQLVETMSGADDRWWDASRTAAFIASLSIVQRQRITAMRTAPGVKYRTAYRRTRNGVAVWEVRPDDISGCLRTARGGSSKQAVVKLGNGRLQVRWMTPLEYARLMGADDYDLSGARTNQALFAFGDAVAVPAVAWLAEHYLMPLVKGTMPLRRAEHPAYPERGDYPEHVERRDLQVVGAR
jgi:DNA (cytosine-5)-methyltransferase 1